eukprot:scaffold9343_cov110-Isochrysis_galbana.AAC.1
MFRLLMIFWVIHDTTGGFSRGTVRYFALSGRSLALAFTASRISYALGAGRTSNSHKNNLWAQDPYRTP